jgi:hypothetical protein
MSPFTQTSVTYSVHTQHVRTDLRLYSERCRGWMCVLPWLLLNRDNYDIFATTADY